MSSGFSKDRTVGMGRGDGVGAESQDAMASARAKLYEIATTCNPSDDVRREKCLAISDRVLASSKAIDSPNFQAIAGTDLQFMAERYDELFFQGQCFALARRFGLTFRWSSRMTSAGGKTIRTTARDRKTGQTKISYEIALSSTLLFQTFSDLQRPIRVTGVLCTNRLQAMQRILEHELVHLTEMLVWDDSCCAAERFQGIAHRLFAHTEHRHELITQQERAAKKFNMRVGSLVKFEFDGKVYIGNVNRITNRATVLVCDSSGQLFTDGKRYRKFYVPLNRLELLA